MTGAEKIGIKLVREFTTQKAIISIGRHCIVTYMYTRILDIIILSHALYI